MYVYIYRISLHSLSRDYFCKRSFVLRHSVLYQQVFVHTIENALLDMRCIRISQSNLRRISIFHQVRLQHQSLESMSIVSIAKEIQLLPRISVAIKKRSSPREIYDREQGKSFPSILSSRAMKMYETSLSLNPPFLVAISQLA